MTKYINQILGLFYAITKINWIKFIRNYDRSAKDILFICPIFPRRFIEYIFRTTFITDLGILNQLLERNLKFRIILGSKNIGKLFNKNIHYNISYHFNHSNLSNHSSPVYFLISELEKQSNNCFLPSDHILYWENKEYMHAKFNELNVNTPVTLYFKIDQEGREVLESILSKISFPFLWKDTHSAGSLGVHLIASEEDFFDMIKLKKEKHKTDYLIQELIDMRSDLRVTLVGNKIVHHYWRFNNSDNWKPTSTMHGSKADFKSFPDHWRERIIEEFKKLNLYTGAFDITWAMDDFNSEPIILEVSPSYDLNPPQPSNLDSKSYKQYKSIYFHKNAYFKGRVNEIFKNKKILYDYIEQTKINFK